MSLTIGGSAMAPVAPELSYLKTRVVQIRSTFGIWKQILNTADKGMPSDCFGKSAVWLGSVKLIFRCTLKIRQNLTAGCLSIGIGVRDLGVTCMR
ncbi:hypothetical protein Enr13x_51740 [Stieleria neptunia]|uniref:Uncharacterized protein n=1 Tax=Stieleria neptunia TaxID=2527979 RepID=A0A518HWR3_9BACT|nr:hypothetical protein Enr13x_51740 [Stieleria neptunia]